MHGKLLLLATAMLFTSPAWAEDEAAMLKLAGASGCLGCHQVNAGAPGIDGQPPTGPAWRDVAQQYRGKPGALERLTDTVMTGSNPYASHWVGKVSGMPMPRNAVVIDREQARALVGWILSLEPLRRM